MRATVGLGTAADEKSCISGSKLLNLYILLAGKLSSIGVGFIITRHTTRGRWIMSAPDAVDGSSTGT